MARSQKLELAPEGTNTEISQSDSAPVLVDALTPVETMIDLDAKGKVLLFDPKENFVRVSEETLRVFSKENRVRYQFAADFHKSWQGVSAIDGRISVDMQLVSKPTEKLEVMKVPKGTATRWVRPEMIRDRMAKGWKIAGDEVESYLGQTGGLHRISQGGRDELILMTRPSSELSKAYVKKVEVNNKLAGFRPKVVTAEASAAGLSEYDEEHDTKKRSWKDQATADSVGEE